MQIVAGIRKLARFFIGMFLLVSVGLVYWQVIVAPQVIGNIHNGRSCLSDSAPVRGRIFDRNGVLLAESVADANGPCGYLRKYYEPSLANIIGYYAGPNFASTGIEAQYENYLSGKVGLTALDNETNTLLHRPPIGDDIYLTLDVRIQRIVANDFDTPIAIDNNNTFASDRGSVIVTNPHTGEVLAMLSRPGYDPNKLVTTLAQGDLSYYNQLNSNKEQPLLTRPLQATYIPGSSYKTLTLIAGLDSGKTTLDQAFDQQHALGPITYNGQSIGPVGNNIGDYTIRFPVTTEYGFSHSDNIIYAQIGVNTSFDTWMDYNKRFYVGQQIPFDLPVTPSNVLPTGKTTLANNELAADSFGQGFDAVTPMQMSLIDNAVANDGQLMQPAFLSKVVDRNGTLQRTFAAQSLGVGAQMTSQTAAEVRRAMFGVIRCGSGSIVSQLFSSNMGIIGKTGTAEVGGGQHAHSWLITQAPYSVTNAAQLPALTIVGMKENAGEGGAAVGPMIAAMYQDIFTTVMKNVQLPGPSSATYCCSEKLLQIGCPA